MDKFIRFGYIVSIFLMLVCVVLFIIAVCNCCDSNGKNSYQNVRCDRNYCDDNYVEPKIIIGTNGKIGVGVGYDGIPMTFDGQTALP